MRLSDLLTLLDKDPAGTWEQLAQRCRVRRMRLEPDRSIWGELISGFYVERGESPRAELHIWYGPLGLFHIHRCVPHDAETIQRLLCTGIPFTLSEDLT